MKRISESGCEEGKRDVRENAEKRKGKALYTSLLQQPYQSRNKVRDSDGSSTRGWKRQHLVAESALHEF